MTTTTPPVPAASESPTAPRSLCLLAVRNLPRMFLPHERLFCQTLRDMDGSLRPEGVSRRYTATVLLGLSRSPQAWQAEALAGHEPDELLDRLRDEIDQMTDPGEVALTLWAARAWNHPLAATSRQRLRELRPEAGQIPMVELAWCLSAVADHYAAPGDPWLAGELARRIVASLGPAGLFPHWPVGAARPWRRAHVCCFADQVYPIQALSLHHATTGSSGSLAAAERCGRTVCRLQGAAGQWWWHYDVRTGRVIERYPVYAVHQHAMAPMALAALRQAGGANADPCIARGLDWLNSAREIRGSLIDAGQDVIWRKVARREPRRLVRMLQAAASRIHPLLRVPGLGLIFRPGWIDREMRPYEMGWILYAWAQEINHEDAKHTKLHQESN